MKEVIELETLRAVVGAELIESSRVPGTKHFSYVSPFIDIRLPSSR